MSTRDHTVPQLYLRRFADVCERSRRVLRVVPVDEPEKAFVADVRKVAAIRGFYWMQLPDGTADHSTEIFFQKIETAAAPVLTALLDDPQYALSRQWPLRPGMRERLAWFLAGQLTRTTRQRKRLAHAAGDQQLRPTASVDSYVRNHRHIQFIAELTGNLAWLISTRPWGLGFSDVCLTTSDVPVVLLDGHDHEDQLAAASVADILMPLDPHRFLFLPGPHHYGDPRKRVDHRLKLDSGLGLFVTEIIRDAADQIVIEHPKHQPPEHPAKGASPRLPTPWSDGANKSTPQYSVSYNTMPPDVNVEAKWLSMHPPARRMAAPSTAKAGPNEE